jgi:hypothetical protein
VGLRCRRRRRRRRALLNSFKIIILQPVQQRPPPNPIIMPRPLPIPNPLLKETTKVLQRIVPIRSRPRGLKPLDLNVVRVQEFPGWTRSTSARGAYIRVADDSVGVWLEGDVVAEVVAREVLGSKNTNMWLIC